MTSVANALYCGMDLHSNNTFIALTDERDRAVLERRVPNELATVLRAIEPLREQIAGIAVESTFNWYWLVDGLMDSGYPVHLTNPAAAKQYEGLKFTDDRHDARWLAHMLRLGILPTGYIYPKEERAVRDLLRKHIRFVSAAQRDLRQRPQPACSQHRPEHQGQSAAEPAPRPGGPIRD